MSKNYFELYFGLPKGAIFISIVLIVFFLWLYSYERALNYEFDGIIQKVEYSEPKHIPTITIKGIQYDLGYNYWDDGQQRDIEKGDSAIKKKGTTDFTLIKK